jgi:redox-sensitive bicupin YhaK (pirin superfamily)
MRSVGPFVFFDHMGPANFPPGTGIDVRPHPHIGLATVTYLFEGEIVHRDNLGFKQAIEPGAINWMTAGRGIAHSERTGDALRKTGSRLHGLQLWVALPKVHEEAEPAFVHHPAATLPEVTIDGVRLRVLAGRAYGVASPVQTLSTLFYVEARMPEGTTLAVPTEPAERAAYVVEGEVSCDGELIAAPRMIVFGRGSDATLYAGTNAHVVLLGGDPLDGERHLWWNFVSSSQERIEQAKRDWAENRFAPVPGETERIPLPER